MASSLAPLARACKQNSTSLARMNLDCRHGLPTGPWVMRVLAAVPGIELNHIERLAGRE
jgi:hypothetical protein